MTPGQAAYEGYCGDDTHPVWDDDMDPWLRRKWERAAQRGHEAIAVQDARPAPELAALRDGIRQLLADVTASADATRPSRKSTIEDETAIVLRKLLEP